MRKIALLTALGAAVLSAQPEPGFQQSWRHYSFAVRLIGGGVLEGIGLDGKSRLEINPGDTTSLRGDLLLASPRISFSWGGGLGVRMDAHRVSFFALWSATEAEHNSLGGTESADLFSAGLDYRYDFFSDRSWRPTVGGGVHFAYRDLDRLFLPESGAPRRARLSGNGFQLAAGMGWWWRERIAVVAETEYRLVAYRNIGLGDEGFIVDGYLFGHSWTPRLEFWILF